MLTVVGAISAIIGQEETAILVFALVLLNIVMGSRQELKARESAEALQSLNVPSARALRDNAVVELSSEDLVPGDIVMVEAGDLVPADGRILVAASLEVVESALTGESAPVEKNATRIEDPLIASGPLKSDSETQSDPPAVEATQQPSGTTTAELTESVAATQADRKYPFNVQLVYSPSYLINLGGLERLHPFDIKKYQRIHDQLVADGLVRNDQTLQPSSLTVDDLKLIHSDQYLEDLKVRKNVARFLEAGMLEYAPVSLETAVMEPFRRASAGTLLAARKALENGIGINIGGGYHHAKPEIGEGFCLYADVPIAIRKLQQEDLIKTALVVDVDVHQGNGTAVCLAGDDSTFCFSMHQGDIYPIPKEESDLDVELDSGMRDDEYLRLLESNLSKLFDQSSPDICFIVGGCDTLAGDPLASLKMTPAGIVSRDAMIVRHCVDRNVPVVLTLSGGYSPDAWKAQYESIKNLIETYSLASEDSKPRQELIEND